MNGGANLASGSPGAKAEETIPRLLIVDDIADNRIILGRRFERRNFKIVEAESGTRALELIAQDTFDAVLLDVMMPDVNGLDVLKTIRQTHSPAALPVIMVTANNLSEDIVKALDSGANDYVAKPIDFAVALSRVNAQIERKRTSAALAEAYAALARTNEELERRVVERTAQLSAINQQLKSEIAHRELSEAHTQYLAHHDALTGVGNRLMFREELQRALQVSKLTHEPVAVLFIDLDGFKVVNDTLGHSVGDALLKILANRLRDTLPEDVVIARLGGDEFGVLQAAARAPERTISLADQIIELVSEPVRFEAHNLMVTSSVGIAASEGPDDNVENLLKRADLAMYRAKSDGRAVVGPGTYRVFDPVMDAAAQAVLRMKSEMRTALTSGGFRLHYQPLVSIDTRRVTGFEALLRWPHSERDIPPSEFIPVAEDTGVIVQLGEWVLREACREACRWPENISVAVNVSPLQFQKGDLVSTVMNALASSRLAAGRLEIEITEAVLLDRTERNTRILQRLRALGVRVSMDDFGTGFSSLSYLRSFPFDKIKIDQSFVRTLSDDGRSQTIVSAIAGLGQSFGMSTVGEGVETEEQVECLMLKGCSEVQGRFYSMPVPAGEIPGLIAKINGQERVSEMDGDRGSA
jgi:diguanylate cyclase (GGDEF)-like protein